MNLTLRYQALQYILELCITDRGIQYVGSCYELVTGSLVTGLMLSQMPDP